LNDLRPTYKLLLELVEVFLVREEYEHVLAVLHLGAEYLPLLAWQAATGDAGHPRMIHKRYGARQAGWRGDDGCALSQQQRQHLPAVFWIAHHPEPAPWRNYLLDQHSKIADVVATCGGAPVLEAVTSSRICTTPCVVVTRLPREKREGLAWGMELSRRFRSSAVLEMRHRSPVGHFFSVPQAEELQRAWSRTWDKLMHDAPSAPAACNPLAEVPKTGSLPGLAALFSAVSPTPLTASHVIGTLTDAIVRSINMGTQ
jgi:hypothetical protein